MSNLESIITVKAAARKADCIEHEALPPSKFDNNPPSASTTRDGLFLLLMLLLAALLLHHFYKRSPNRTPIDEEVAQDSGPALPGPHINANTRLQLNENRPQTFYDWVRASNADARGLTGAG